MKNKKIILLVAIVMALLTIVILMNRSKKAEATNIQKTYVCHCEQPDSDSPFQCQTLHVAVPAALAHLYQHDADYQGVCKEVEPSISPTPTEEPKDYCDTLEGTQAEDEDCPEEEEPTPTPTKEPEHVSTLPGSTTETPASCPINDISRVANIFVKTTGNKGELEVQWALPANADEAHIEYGLEKNATHALLNTPNDGNEVIKGLKSGEHYWFRVAGVRDCGVGAFSDWFDPIVP